MRWILLVPGALVPPEVAPALVEAMHMPKGLAQRLLRATQAASATDGFNRNAARQSPDDADALAAASPPHLNWLAHAFGASDRPTPTTAPYALRMLRNATTPTAMADDDLLWHADPVHFAYARDHLLVTPLMDASDDPSLEPGSTSGLTEADQVALLAAAHEYTSPAGIAFEHCGGRWFLRLPADWHVQTTPLPTALHRPLHEVWPEGPDGQRWQRLMNNIQIAWHQLPLNQMRIEAGLREVNGLWLHGGGRWRPLQPPSALAPLRYCGNDPVLQGWAAAASSTPASVLGSQAAASNEVEVWHGFAQAFRTDAWGDWLLAWAAFTAHLERQLAQATERGVATFELVLFGARSRRSLLLQPTDRLRLWRPTGARNLAALLTETH